MIGKSISHYRIIEKLGEGGMGVVYKARHLKLNRIVALKMILAGQLASAEAVRRFQLEAESAANLERYWAMHAATFQPSAFEGSWARKGAGTEFELEVAAASVTVVRARAK